MEAEIDKGGVELNYKGKNQKSYEVVSGRMTFPENPPLYTPALASSPKIPKNQAG